MNMENDRYESPKVEIIKMQVEQSLLISSVAGEDIYEWEDIDEHTAKAVTKFVAQHNCGSSKPAEPEPYDYYISDNQIYMYYNREWCKTTRPMDYIWEIECPVVAIVNYEIQQLEGVYQ